MASFRPSVNRCVRPLLVCLFLLALATVGLQPVGAHSESGRADTVSRTAPVPAQIVQIATSTGLPNVIVILLRTTDKWLPPRYSLDAGQTWQEVVNVPLDQMLTVALAPRQIPDPQQNVRILLGIYNHIYRTGDYGHTWATAFTSDGTWSAPFQALFMSPANPERLYSMIHFGWRLPLDLYYQDLARSDDGGVTWSVVDEIVTSGGCYGFIPSPVLATRTYLGCGNADWRQSDDGGQTWTPKTNFPWELALDAQEAAWLYGLTDEYSTSVPGRSTDTGNTWTPWPNPPCKTGQLMAHPTKTRVLFLLCSSGLYRSSDAGDHWALLSSTQEGFLDPDYGVLGRILWARSDGLWASSDDGDHWQLLHPPSVERVQTFVPLVQR